jgi:hypothetical protein
MSAYLVSETHVDLLIEYAIATSGSPFHSVQWRSEMPPDDPRALAGEWRELDRNAEVDIAGDGVTLADHAARLLLCENLRSVRYRYPDEDAYPEGGYDVAAQTHRFTRTGYVLSDAEAVRACDCIEYQSCEHPDYHESEAWRLLAAIRDHAVDGVVRSALAREWGTVSPPWEWDAEVIRLAKSRKGVRA